MTEENEVREEPRYLAFGEFRVDTLRRKLYRGAEPVRVAAVRAMARAVERREVMVWTLKLDPRFEGLRRHPEYPSLLEALHLPEGGAAIARGPLEAEPTGLARSLAQEECPPVLSLRLSPLENC